MKQYITTGVSEWLEDVTSQGSMAVSGRADCLTVELSDILFFRIKLYSFIVENFCVQMFMNCSSLEMF